MEAEAVLDEDAGVFNYEKAGGAGFGGCCGVGDSLLHPDDFGADFDGAVDYRRDVSGAAEDVDDFDVVGWRDVFEARVGFFSEDFGFVGIYGDDAIAGGLHVLGNTEAGSRGPGRKADDRDGIEVFQDVGDDVGAVREVIGERDVHRSAGSAMLKLARPSVGVGAKWFVAVAGFVRISWAAGVGVVARAGKFISWAARIGAAAWAREFVSRASGLKVAAWAGEFSFGAIS